MAIEHPPNKWWNFLHTMFDYRMVIEYTVGECERNIHVCQLDMIISYSISLFDFIWVNYNGATGRRQTRNHLSAYGRS
jgi:hypothetical protein